MFFVFVSVNVKIEDNAVQLKELRTLKSNYKLFFMYLMIHQEKIYIFK